jgi:scyllo-inositol 2-dehydrogenase (NADP+)
MTSPHDDIDVGLVGFGLAGRVFHAPVIRAVPGLRLAAIMQRTGETAAQAYPDVRVVRSLDELLAMNAIRLVVIATPNASHAEIARRCLEAGRDVVVDKPCATTSVEAAALLALADHSGRMLSVFQNRRWDGDFITVQRLLREGTCGRPVLFESCFDRYRPRRRPGSWRERAEPGSGILFDLGSHLVDQAVTLFGSPDAVTGDVRLERDDAAADDAFDVTFHYPRMRALLRASVLACEPGPRFVLRGTEATYVKHHLDPQEEMLARGDRPGIGAWGEDRPERWGTLSRSTPEGIVRETVATAPGDYRLYYENVRDAVVGHAALAVTPRQAVVVIRLLELAQESSRQGRTIAFEE